MADNSAIRTLDVDRMEDGWWRKRTYATRSMNDDNSNGLLMVEKEGVPRAKSTASHDGIVCTQGHLGLRVPDARGVSLPQLPTSCHPPRAPRTRLAESRGLHRSPTMQCDDDVPVGSSFTFAAVA
jgi:hypothetical protein